MPSEHVWITSVAIQYILSKKWAWQVIAERTLVKHICVFFTGLYFDLLEIGIYIIGWEITKLSHFPQWGGALKACPHDRWARVVTEHGIGECVKYDHQFRRMVTTTLSAWFSKNPVHTYTAITSLSSYSVCVCE